MLVSFLRDLHLKINRSLVFDDQKIPWQIFMNACKFA